MLRSIAMTPVVLPLSGSGMDHVAAGVGLRNRGAGSIELSGAPPGAVLEAAFLYWGVIASSNAASAFSDVELEGVAVSGTSLGSTDQPCWSELGDFYGFRADVTSLIAASVNGTYRLVVPAATSTNHNSPWNGNALDSTPPLLEGASLVAIYSHPDLPSTARVYLHEKVMPLDERPLMVRHALSPSLPAGDHLRHTRIGGDGQRRGYGSQLLIPFETRLGAYRSNFDDLTVIRGPGSPVDEASDWQGTDGGSETQLWDTRTTPLPRESTNLGHAASYNVLYQPARECRVSEGPPLEEAYDCVVVVAHVLSVR